MNILLSIYTIFLWQPIFNALVFFYNVIPYHDLGVAVVGVTLISRIILAPLLYKFQKGQKKIARLQPEIKKIQDKLKKDKEAQGKALMELYSKHGVNPLSGCLVMLIQFPILIALFSVFRQGLNPAELSYLYPFIHNPITLNPIAFGFLDLSKGNIYFGILAAIIQYLQIKTTMSYMPESGGGESEEGMAITMQKQSMYFVPIIIFISSIYYPLALIFYWTTSNIFAMVQEILVERYGNGRNKKSNFGNNESHGL